VRVRKPLSPRGLLDDERAAALLNVLQVPTEELLEALLGARVQVLPTALTVCGLGQARPGVLLALNLGRLGLLRVGARC